MDTEFKPLVAEISAKLREFAREIPDSYGGFQDMARATHGDGALSKKHKELMAMAIAISARCHACLGFHAQACVRQGVSRGEFLEMLQVAIYMGGGPALMTAAEALLAYEEYGGERAA